MAARKGFSIRNLAAWVIIGLLFIGLAGFGFSDIVRSGLATSAARVGDESISSQEFAQAFTQELNRRGRQGQGMTIEQARTFGLDQFVIGQMIRERALKAEATRLGLSVTDDVIQEQIAEIPDFRGPDGNFSLDQARFVLSQSGLTEADLRDDLRDAATRNIMQVALTSDVVLPPAHMRTILAYQNEQRSFSWVRLDTARFGGTVDEPTEEALRALYEAEPARFTRPETRQVSYAILQPTDLIETIEVSEDEINVEFEARKDSFSTPERRILQRLTFPDSAEAEAAKARIEAGETTLLEIAVERGFSEENISLGQLTRDSIDATARDAVFGTTEPGLVGPVETSLGPALFVVNAILAAVNVPDDEARATIRTAIATRRAGALAQEIAAEVEDLVAGGATVEELGEETDYSFGTIGVPVTEAGEGLAADEAFRTLVLNAEIGFETDLEQLPDGRFVVVRVDEVQPAALIPFEEITDAVETDWIAAQKMDATRAQAAAMVERVEAGAALARAAMGVGLTPADAGPVRRNGRLQGLPDQFVNEIFSLPADGVRMIDGQDAIYVAQVTAVLGYDPADPAAFLESLQYQQLFNQSYVGDLFTYYLEALTSRDVAVIYPGVMENALNMTTQGHHTQY
ncbi:MAG: peptidyl-prolyl cis-trans isomerase [Pseudomonadota bacterium]